jgi:hypothetical protein
MRIKAETPRIFIHLLSPHVVLQLLLQNKVQTKGVVRPLEPEIYIPGECNSDLDFHACPCGITVTRNSADSCVCVCVCEALEILESSGIKLSERVEI